MASTTTGATTDTKAFLAGLEKSREWHERALQVEPAGVQGSGRFYDPRPVFMRRAKGARIWDVDGNEYLDFHLSYGPSLLGYNDDRVAAAVTKTLRDEGLLFALPHPREVELAETLTRLVPSAEMVIFTCEGSSSMYHAVRAARAHAGKTGILKFEGAYHGWQDDVNASVAPDRDHAGPPDRPAVTGMSDGSLPEAADHLFVAPWNDLETTQAIARENESKIGVVIVEPVMRYILPAAGFLEGIRELCDEIGAVLIFDEIYTGFRAGLSGAQGLFGVTPDLTTLGKAIANGFPLSAVVGKREIMSRLAPGGKVFFSGTFNGMLLCVAAAQETLRILEEENVPERVAAMGNEFQQAINDGIRRIGVPASMVHWQSNWWLFFRSTPPKTYRDMIDVAHTRSNALTLSYVHFMLANGVYIQPYYIVRALLSDAHTEADLERATELTLAWLQTNGKEIEATAA
jgi:glutamate-1-semialdehyde 2,1-aminomutase